MLARLLGLYRHTHPLGARHDIALGDDALSFCLPENFSKDFPAEDIETSVNLSELTENEISKHIVRRWWEINKPGLFNTHLGTLMLNIEVRHFSVNQQSDLRNQELNISNRFHFLLAQHEHMQNDFQPTSKNDPKNGFFVAPIAYKTGNEWLTFFNDEMFNGQMWTRVSVAQMNNALTVLYTLPLVQNAYLRVNFCHAVNQGVSPYEFQHFSMPLADQMLQSLKVTFNSANTLKDAVESEWLTITPQHAITRNAGAEDTNGSLASKMQAH